MELITQKRLLSTLARANLVGAFYSNDADFKIAFRFKNLGKYIVFSSVPTWEKVKVSGGGEDHRTRAGHPLPFGIRAGDHRDESATDDERQPRPDRHADRPTLDASDSLPTGHLTRGASL